MFSHTVTINMPEGVMLLCEYKGKKPNPVLFIEYGDFGHIRYIESDSTILSKNEKRWIQEDLEATEIERVIDYKGKLTHTIHFMDA